MSDEQPQKLNVKTYGIGFNVPPEMAEELQRVAADHVERMSHALWNDSFSFMDFKLPTPTRVQRLRTWLAERLLKVVGWLDYNVIPYD